MKRVIRLLLIVSFVPSLTIASSFRQVTVEQLARSSEFVFRGEVVGTEARWDDLHSAIHTYITFRVDERVSGEYVGAHIVLRFLGGAVGFARFQVSDSTLPRIGERGIYFVERVGTFQVNPLCGADQGHFLISGLPGQEVVTTRGGSLVTRIVPEAALSGSKLSDGIAVGLLVQDETTPSRGITVSEFIREIRELANR